MTRRRLTIIVPTYNRSASLKVLLDALERELAGIADRVSVLVGDNASPDDTPRVTQAFAARVPGTRVIRHPDNLGPDENFCHCVEAAEADYFWIIGDDDLPRRGAVHYVLGLLDQYAPDLVYLESDWRAELAEDAAAIPIDRAMPIALGQLAFGRRVNVWTTFISGLVVRRDTFVSGASPDELRRHAKTNLAQLTWVLGTLQRSHTLLYVPVKCVLATIGGTGGYAVLKVFGENFAAIAGQALGADSPLARAMIRRNVLGYLPALLWTLRFGHVGDFAYEDPSVALRPQLGRYAIAYRLLVAIGRAPRPIARTAFILCKIAARALRVADRIREAFGGRRALA